MQLDFLWAKREDTPPPGVLQLDATRQVAIEFQRNERARRYLLRLRSDGVARITIPRRGSLRQARTFLEENKAWLLRQYLKWQARPQVSWEWSEGSEFFFRGEKVRLELADEGRLAVFATERVPLRKDRSIRQQVEARFLRLAQQEFPAQVIALARQHDCKIGRVTIRNQRSRWGSCSVRGTISLNWRLIQMPPSVKDYIILHELMHTKEMNHSRRYWARVAQVCPDFAAQERWIKTYGRELAK